MKSFFGLNIYKNDGYKGIDFGHYIGILKEIKGCDVNYQSIQIIVFVFKYFGMLILRMCKSKWKPKIEPNSVFSIMLFWSSILIQLLKFGFIFVFKQMIGV